MRHWIQHPHTHTTQDSGGAATRTPSEMDDFMSSLAARPTCPCILIPCENKFYALPIYKLSVEVEFNVSTAFVKIVGVWKQIAIYEVLPAVLFGRLVVGIWPWCAFFGGMEPSVVGSPNLSQHSIRPIPPPPSPATPPPPLPE